jgi:hypothetical protein
MKDERDICPICGSEMTDKIIDCGNWAMGICWWCTMCWCENVKLRRNTDEKSSSWVCVADTHCDPACRMRSYSSPTAYRHSLPDLYPLSNTHANAANTYTSTD